MTCNWCGYEGDDLEDFPASEWDRRGKFPNEYPVKVGDVCWVCWENR